MYITVECDTWGYETYLCGDDTTTVCGVPPDGTEDWESGFGDDDYWALAELAAYLNNPQIIGYILDGNNIITYNITSINFQPESINSRCGY